MERLLRSRLHLSLVSGSFLFHNKVKIKEFAGCVFTDWLYLGRRRLYGLLGDVTGGHLEVSLVILN